MKRPTKRERWLTAAKVAGLFTHAAERAAIVSGRPVSQESLRVRGLDAAPAGPLLVLHGFSADAAWCGERGGSATTDLRAVTCEPCRKVAAHRDDVRRTMRDRFVARGPFGR